MELHSQTDTSANDVWQICSADLRNITPSMTVATPMITNSPMVGSSFLHATSSMPANLHLVNTGSAGGNIPGSSATAMILSPANNLNDMTDGSGMGNRLQCVTIGPMNGNGVNTCGVGNNTGVCMPSSFGGSSGSSGPVLTAESSACSIPSATVENGFQNSNSNHHHHHHEYHHDAHRQYSDHYDDFMSMEVSLL